MKHATIITPEEYRRQLSALYSKAAADAQTCANLDARLQKMAAPLAEAVNKLLGQDLKPQEMAFSILDALKQRTDGAASLSEADNFARYMLVKCHYIPEGTLFRKKEQPF